jgi:Ca2+-binding RTX toxin-like protein
MTRSLPVLVLALLLSVAGTASASTVTADDVTIVVTAAPGEQNYVEINAPGVTLEVHDRAGLTAGAGCEQLSPTHARCPANQVQERTLIDLGDGNDYYHEQFEHLQDDVDAGPGDDEIYTDLDDDIVRGGPGNDKISGGSGSDQLDGADGDDTVTGNAQGDTLYGGRGTDLIEGDGASTDDGSDVIYAQDAEKDTVSCDNGTDKVEADDVDTVDLLCEDVTRFPSPNVCCAPPVLDISASLASAMKLTKFLKNGLAFKVKSNGPATFAAGLFVPKKTAKKFGLGNKTIVIASGGGKIDDAGTAKAKLTDIVKKKKLRALLDRDGFKRLPVVFEVLATNQNGEEDSVRKKLKLTR